MAKNRRITITNEDVKAINMLYDLFRNADEGTDDPGWMPVDDREVMESLYRKICGK